MYFFDRRTGKIAHEERMTETSSVRDCLGQRKGVGILLEILGSNISFNGKTVTEALKT